MKIFNKVLLSFLLFLAVNVSATIPQAIPYQAVARDNAGNLIINQNISLRFSIRDISVLGTIVYQETQNSVTNSLGLFSVNIGTGSIVTGTFSGINWGSNSKFMQVEFDPTGGISYTDMGTTQLMSVPYALYSEKSADLPAGTGIGNTMHWNGTAWVADNAIVNNGSNVGIGAPIPAAKLDVAGTIKITDGSQGAGKVLTSNASGLASWQQASGGATYRWASFHTYDPGMGFSLFNDANMFGGVTPSNWTDGNALASQISASKDVQRTLFQKKGYAKENGMLFCDQFYETSSTDGEVFTALFRISNTTGAAITWTPNFIYTAYTTWGEKASITVNGANSWSSGTSGSAAVSLSIPSGQVSTVIFVCTSGIPTTVSGAFLLRSCQFGFYNNSLTLPAGLQYVDDLDTATGGWGN
ncbi:MAG: hypothetical protein IPG90_17950 [Bacteroidetes bacterium]|nr:hypothetical protein [Bacteroidota bacterium]